MPAQCAMKEIRLGHKPRRRPTLRGGVDRESDAWVIKNAAGDVVFVGTKRECEDWLDWQENQQ